MSRVPVVGDTTPADSPRASGDEDGAGELAATGQRFAPRERG